jgi:hypothetical protein
VKRGVTVVRSVACIRVWSTCTVASVPPSAAVARGAMQKASNATPTAAAADRAADDL